MNRPCVAECIARTGSHAKKMHTAEMYRLSKNRTWNSLDAMKKHIIITIIIKQRKIKKKNAGWSKQSSIVQSYSLFVPHNFYNQVELFYLAFLPQYFQKEVPLGQTKKTRSINWRKNWIIKKIEKMSFRALHEMKNMV